MLTTSPAGAARPDSSVVKEKPTKDDQQLLRLTFDALAKGVSNVRVSFPAASSSAKAHKPLTTHGTESCAHVGYRGAWIDIFVWRFDA